MKQLPELWVATGKKLVLPKKDMTWWIIAGCILMMKDPTAELQLAHQVAKKLTYW